MSLTQTSYAILGMLSLGPHSGYEIKRIADHSIRHFWALNYAQIYPELERLARAGLVSSTSEKDGRAKTTYALAPGGRRALRTWLATDDSPPVEMRDEMLLRLFFSDVLTPAERQELFERVVERQRRLTEALEALRPHVQEKHVRGTAGPSLVLECGIAIHEAFARFIARAADAARNKGRSA